MVFSRLGIAAPRTQGVEADLANSEPVEDAVTDPEGTLEGAR